MGFDAALPAASAFLDYLDEIVARILKVFEVHATKIPDAPIAGLCTVLALIRGVICARGRHLGLPPGEKGALRRGRRQISLAFFIDTFRPSGLFTKARCFALS